MLTLTIVAKHENGETVQFARYLDDGDRMPEEMRHAADALKASPRFTDVHMEREQPDEYIADWEPI